MRRLLVAALLAATVVPLGPGQSVGAISSCGSGYNPSLDRANAVCYSSAGAGTRVGAKAKCRDRNNISRIYWVIDPVGKPVNQISYAYCSTLVQLGYGAGPWDAIGSSYVIY